MEWVIGGTTVKLISAGTFLDDASMFFPREAVATGYRPPDQLTLALNCLLIQSGSKRILVDTGFGDKPGDVDDVQFSTDSRRLVEELRALGGPQSIDVVINTHLHADHCGGNTKLMDGTVQPTYPRAEYWAQRAEWREGLRLTDWRRALYRSENVEPVERAGHMRWLNGSTQVTAEVRCVIAPGHTSRHQYVEVSDGQRSLLFLGDVAPTWHHMEQPWLPSNVDLDPNVSAHTRRDLCGKAIAESSLVILTHEACPGCILTSECTEQEFRFVPVAKHIITA